MECYFLMIGSALSLALTLRFQIFMLMNGLAYSELPPLIFLQRSFPQRSLLQRSLRLCLKSFDQRRLQIRFQQTHFLFLRLNPL